MPQITNNALNDSVNRIEARVGKLEKRMDDNDGVIKDMKKALDALVSEFKAARIVLGLLGAVVTPVFTAIVVLIIQHVWGK
jgi:hypothetical protein